MREYDVGDQRRMHAYFTAGDPAVPADPTTVVFYIRNEADEEAETYAYGEDVEVVKVATGHYYLDWTFDRSGLWYWAAYGEGEVVASATETVAVRLPRAAV